MSRNGSRGVWMGSVYKHPVCVSNQKQKQPFHCSCVVFHSANLAVKGICTDSTWSSCRIKKSHAMWPESRKAGVISLPLSSALKLGVMCRGPVVSQVGCGLHQVTPSEGVIPKWQSHYTQLWTKSLTVAQERHTWSHQIKIPISVCPASNTKMAEVYHSACVMQYYGNHNAWDKTSDSVNLSLSTYWILGSWKSRTQ